MSAGGHIPEVGSEVKTRSGTFPSVPYVRQEDGSWKPKYGEDGAPALHSPAPFTARDLAALPDGARLKDVTGDRWLKKEGKWHCLDAVMLGEALLHVWGPLTRTDEPAMLPDEEEEL